jgi:hypothetical protein
MPSLIYRGILYRNAVPGVLSQKDATRNCVPETYMPRIGVTSPRLRPNWVTMRYGALFLRKIALSISIYLLQFFWRYIFVFSHFRSIPALLNFLSEHCLYGCMLEISNKPLSPGVWNSFFFPNKSKSIQLPSKFRISLDPVLIVRVVQTVLKVTQSMQNT